MAPSTTLAFLLLLSWMRETCASMTYQDFRRVHGRAALDDDMEVSYEARENLFHRRQAEAFAHNAHNLSWRMAVNRYSDFTDTELRRMLGYKRVGGRWNGEQSAASGGFSLIQAHEYEVNLDMSDLAGEVDWRGDLQKSATWVRNQGGCGSCWAVASIGALEMHMEKKLGIAQRLSPQQLVDCVPNPKHCGGTGGCQGATGELAFEHVRRHGISAEDAYRSQSGKCNSRAQPSQLRLSRFVRLPENQAKPLQHALATQGPVVVSVDGSGWYGYDSGVFAGCDKDCVVNHAVLAVGYGNDRGGSNKDYWTIRNSWGPDWGEHGFMRIERHTDDAYCGVDNAPQEGVFCEGGPKSVPVCGMCGITSDSAFPSLRSHGKRSSALRASSQSTGIL